jgi:hypothetical protein
MQVFSGFQIGLLGILGDVALEVLDLFRASDEVVETLLLP